ncbi:PilT/PilU family type 4a pilus ATPase [Litoribrevibacter albus]|uniref:Twitching motility protein PilT n=1 Tax=Litoribrevibacter albus TaxID=1473156 RepID=A0AA37SDJ1_9GAMM|nr:PilT/PilU family type 4a pilus ATPase [Litoribrevibacter albus]GLQ32418.1 twitching motility protein PilT [Litoribrevibacter albus]
MDVTRYLSYMVEKDASDIFFAANAPVLLRVNNETRPINPDTILDAQDVKDMAYSLLTEQLIERFEKELELNAGISVDDIGRFRVSLLKQRKQVSAVIRLIHSEPPTVEELHLPSILKTLAEERRGLILVAGATASGKSSTLAAMLNHRNESSHGHILTIEDPIEYLHSYKKCIVNQRELGVDTHSYAEALKNAVRDAPDVILIGEIRDQVTMQNAITFAETGHLCLATIHASNAIETLDRAVNFFPEAYHHQVLMDLSRNLNAIICQRLIRGEKSLWPAIELIQNSPYIQELIQKGEFDQIREAISRRTQDKDKAITFDNSLISLYLDGRITKEEAIASADSKHNMAVQLRLLDERGNHRSV